MLNKLYAELDTDFIKYIYANASGRKASIKKYGIKEMPEGTFINGRVVNREAFIKVLSAIKKELGIRRSSTYLSMRDGSIITRPLKLPIHKEKDIERHLSLEADHYLPINKNSCQISFKIMGNRFLEDGTMSSVMVAAAPTESINSILECFDGCKLNPKVMDVFPNIVCRLFGGVEEENIAVIDIGRKGINIVITENRSFYMHSCLQLNMKTELRNFMKECSISEEGFYDKYYYKELDFNSINSDAAIPEKGLEEALSNVMWQISRYLDYYNSRHFGEAVDMVYVTGEHGMLRGLKKIMGYSFRTNVTIGIEPVKYISIKADGSFEDLRMSYYSMLGMTMRGSKL